MNNFVGKRKTYDYLRSAPWLVFLGGFGLAVIGFVANRTWSEISWDVVTVLAGLALLSLSAAFVIRRLTGLAMATSMAVAWLIALVYFAGLSSSAAAVLLALAAMALGSIVIPEGWGARVALSTLVGLALLSGVTGWLLPLPMHYRAFYLVVLLAVVFIRWRAVTGMLRSLSGSWCTSVSGSPAIAWSAVMVTGIISTSAWMPTIHYDDLAYHVGLPSQLASLGYYQMNAATNLWAVSAWAADVLQGIIWLLAGHESRGVLDVLWLTLTLVLMWRLSEALELPPWARWLAVALYASLPLTAGALSSMQTEGPTAAVAVAIALLIQRSPGPERRQFVAIVLLFGLLLALKVSNLTVAGPLGLWLLCRWRAHLTWRAVPSGLLLLLLVAGSSYVYAWALTGNPVLPVFNGIFHSQYYAPVNFHDRTWNAGFDWDILWGLVFHTSRYVEGGDGAAGFVIIALGGSLLAALFNHKVRPLALVALGAFFLPLTQLQYLRYTHQAFVLLIPAMLCGVPWLASGSRYLRAGMASIAVLVLTNLVFIASAGWQQRNGVLWTFLTDTPQSFTSKYAPVYGAIDTVRSRYGANARVLITSPAVPFAAGFAGKAFVVSWYDQEVSVLARRANQDPSGEAWTRILDFTGANFLILRSDQVSAGLAAAVETSHGSLVYQDGDLQLWEVGNEVTGIVQPSPDGEVSVHFDTSTLPARPMLAHAQLVLHCVPQDVSIGLAWRITGPGGESWSRNEWATCLQDGSARASLDVSMPGQISTFTVSAKPARPAPLALAVMSSGLDVRADLGAERDLAKQMRRNLQRAVASWLSPWRPRYMHEGSSMPSPANTVKVKFDTMMAPHQAGFVRAALELKCNNKGVPIVVGWTLEEAGSGPTSRYEWARCGQDGLAHASIDVRTSRRLVTFMVTAASSSKVIDTGLRMSSAEAAYLPREGARGLIVRKRIKLAEWLRPKNEIHSP